MPRPLNITLYNKVKNEAKRKFDVWPSAYASSWLVREYKKRGGKYTSGPNPSKKSKSRLRRRVSKSRSRKRRVSKSRYRKRRVSKSRARKHRVSKSHYRRRRVSKSRSRRRRNSRSRCRYGIKLNGSCKKKPGPKRR